MLSPQQCLSLLKPAPNVQVALWEGDFDNFGLKGFPDHKAQSLETDGICVASLIQTPRSKSMLDAPKSLKKDLGWGIRFNHGMFSGDLKQQVADLFGIAVITRAYGQEQSNFAIRFGVRGYRRGEEGLIGDDNLDIIVGADNG